jgi:ankyrin repeat protein
MKSITVGGTPLHSAIRAGNAELTLRLLEKNGKQTLIEDSNKMLPFHYATVQFLKDLSHLLPSKPKEVQVNLVNGIMKSKSVDGFLFLLEFPDCFGRA